MSYYYPWNLEMNLSNDFIPKNIQNLSNLENIQNTQNFENWIVDRKDIILNKKQQYNFKRIFSGKPKSRKIRERKDRSGIFIRAKKRSQQSQG